MVSSIERFHCIQDNQLVPMVSSIERFHCIHMYVPSSPSPPPPHTQVFFIDHNTKQTTFIDPRLPLSGEGVSLPVSLKAPEGEGEEGAAEQQVRLTDALTHTCIGWSAYVCTYLCTYVRMYEAHIQL